MNIQIYVMTHKKFDEPENALYKPFQVGKAIGENLGYEGDDTKDNISAQNPYFGELTGLYWIWKNDKIHDYVGLCHYRRYFVNENRELLKKQEYEEIFQTYDVITSNAIYGEKSCLCEYEDAHYIKDLYLVRESIEKLYPNYLSTFDFIMNGKKNYYGNLMVGKKDLVDAYAKWLFTIFFDIFDKIDVHTYDDYHKRVFGFLSELLLLVYLTYHKYKIYEAKIGFTSEKAETRELKLALSQLVKINEIKKARELFHEYTAIRPDVQLALSDIFGELPIMEQILYIIEQEEEFQLFGINRYTNSLSKMVDHYKKLIEIFASLSRNETELSNADAHYMKQTNVTGILVLIMCLNNPDTSFSKDIVKQHMQTYFLQKKDEISLNFVNQIVTL